MVESLSIPPNVGNFTGCVNGQVTGCAVFPQRSFYRTMDLRRILERVERRLEALELSANAASDQAGKPDAIRNLRRAAKNGDRQGITTATLAALAPALRTTVPWLTDGVGPEDVELEERTIPVWGRAGAGGQVYEFHAPGVEIDRITAPAGSNDRTAAVEITGESLGQVFDGWYAVYDEIRDPPTVDLIGRLCVVQVQDGRVFVKRMKKGRGKRFTLESNYDPPIYDVEVAWAAPVKTLIPR